MNPIRVLIVDDSVVVRKLVGRTLAEFPDLEVVGSLGEPKLALQSLKQLNPDVVVLDHEMPGMTGVQMLVELRKARPMLPVIMFSTHSEAGARVTIEALAAGASDYLPKGEFGTGNDAHRMLEELVHKIRTLCRRTQTTDLLSSTPRQSQPGREVSGLDKPAKQARTLPRGTLELVAIAASTGGPHALVSVLAALPADFPAPLLIVQHMPPLFTRLLAERLSAECRVSVKEAEDGERVLAGWAYLAPGGRHLAALRKGSHLILRLSLDPPENSCRPAADVLFRSVAESSGASVLAVVLTGMGQDGYRGCEAIKTRGGVVLAQDEASSVVWGMPRVVVESGLADEVLPLNQMAEGITRRIQISTRGVTLSRTIA